MVHYKPIKVTINAPGLINVIVNVVVRHHDFPDVIVTKQRLLFIFKFWSLLYYFLGIKQTYSTTFYPQTDRQTKKQNNIIKAYLQVFVNFEQNDWAQLLLMAVIAYNNAKNANISYTSFELNYRYYSWVSYKEDFNPRL